MCPWLTSEFRRSGHKLYRQLLHAGATHPQGLEHVRNRVKKEFYSHSQEKDPEVIRKALIDGRWWVQELIRIHQFHKFRAMKNRYDSPPPSSDSREQTRPKGS